MLGQAWLVLSLSPLRRQIYVSIAQDYQMANFHIAGSGRVLHWLEALPIYPTTADFSCSPSTSIHPKINMEVDDPWTWSVERVVQELCTANRSWQPRTTTASVHDPTLLESVLREHEITGSVLLLDVDRDVLRDFGINKLGRISYLLGAIKELRLKSALYQEDLQTQLVLNGVASSVPSTPGVPHAVAQVRFDHSSPFGQLQRTILAGQPHFLPKSSLLPASPAETLSSPNMVESIPVTPSEATLGFVVPNPDSNKRRRLDLTDPANNLALQEEILPPRQVTPVEDTTQQGQPDTPQDVDMLLDQLSTSPTPDPKSLKRKRVSPTLVESAPVQEPETSREVSLLADLVPFPTPGVTFIGQDGRKRLVPVFQQAFNSDAPYDYDTLIRNRRVLDGQTTHGVVEKTQPIIGGNPLSPPADPLDVGYLGKEKWPVDDVFYKGVEDGKEIVVAAEAPDFYEQKRISSGKRLYANSLMKYYFRVQREDFLRNGKLYSAVRPYASKLAPKHQTPAFTLYYSDDDGHIHARREGLRAWPEVNPEASVSDPQPDTNDNTVAFNLGSWEAYGNDFDPDALEKWKDVAGGDEILPVYGESDEENEYDYETWAEIEAEQGTLERPRLPLKRKVLSNTEIDEAIDDGIKEMIDQWRIRELPKKERNAYRIWKTTRQREERRVHVAKIEAQLARIENDRLPKMRKKIAHEQWTSQRQVRRQTRIMEPSLFDQQGHLWEIAVINQQTAPEKPPVRVPSSATRHTSFTDDNDEEGESLGSDSEGSISDDDDLDNFVVDDPLTVDEEIELSFADSEDEGDVAATSSDEGSPEQRLMIVLGGRQSLDVEASEIGKSYEIPSSAIRSHQQIKSSPATSFTEKPLHSSTPKTPTKIFKQEPRSRPLFSASPTTGSMAIDLTMSSPDPEIIDLVTPPKKIKLSLRTSKSPLSPARFKESVVISDGEAPRKPDPNNLPPLNDPAAVAQYDPSIWAEITDIKRLLISVLYSTNPHRRDMLFSFISHVSKIQLWINMKDVMNALVSDRHTVQGMDKTTFETLVNLLTLFKIFTECKVRSLDRQPNKKAIKKLLSRQSLFPAFYDLCQKLEGYFAGKPLLHRDGNEEDDSDSDEGPQSATRRRKPIK